MASYELSSAAIPRPSAARLVPELFADVKVPLDFLLFLFVNAILFIRPAELLPSIEGWPIYNVLIVINLVIAAPAIARHLTVHGITRCPTTACVFGVLAFVAISHVARFNLWSARHGGLEFAKVVVYFVLLVSLVKTPRRFFVLLGAIVAFTLALNALGALQYYGQIDIPALSVLMDKDYDELTGELHIIPRMRATGIFNDPNDLSMIIVAAVILCGAGFFFQRFGRWRFIFAAPIAFLLYCLSLTQSRGGLLALLAGGSVLALCRYGALRGGVLTAAAASVALAAFSPRQTDIVGAIVEGTGQSRAEHWSEGLQILKSAPLFGIGYHEYADHAGGYVAHNSYVHAFTELGFGGGMMFLGVFGVVTFSLWKLRRVQAEIQHPSLRHLLPFMLALVAAYAVSMMSLSRAYVVPTYLVAGMGVAYERLARSGTSVQPQEFNTQLVSRLALGSIGLIGFIYFYIKFLYR